MAPADGVTPRSLVQRILAAKLSNPFRRAAGFLVLDIGSSSVKLAEVHHGPSGPRLTTLDMAPLPPTVVQSNVVQDEGPVVDAVRAVMARRGVQARQVITAVPGPAVMVKKVLLPAQTGVAVESAVLAEAGHLIPDSLDNVNLDYQVIDWIEAGSKMEVLVVAVKKDIINSYTNAIRAADLEPVVVDVDYFALENMFELNYDPPGGHPLALVNIGARYSSINILKNGRSTFTGDSSDKKTRYLDLRIPITEGNRYRIGDVTFEGNTVVKSDLLKPMFKLTPTEYKLLMTLIRHAGKVVTHQQLLREVWGPAHTDQSHYVRIYMAHLRHKLEAEPASPRYFLTEPGVGYRRAAD